jgi:hypothetical protein
MQVAWRRRRAHHHRQRENQIPIALAAQPAPNFPRLRALALFGRRPPQRVVRLSFRRPKTCTIPVIRITLRDATIAWPSAVSVTVWVSRTNSRRPAACSRNRHRRRSSAAVCSRATSSSWRRRRLAASRILSERLPSRVRFSWRDSRLYFWPLMKRRSLPLRRAYSALRTLSSASPRWRMMWNLSNRIAACGASIRPLGCPQQ